MLTFYSPGCRPPTPCLRATLVPRRINAQTLAAQGLIQRAVPRPDLATARFRHPPSQFRTLARATAVQRSALQVRYHGISELLPNHLFAAYEKAVIPRYTRH